MFWVYLAMYPIGVLLSLLGTLICVLFINWWAPLLANEAGYLPSWLRWAQTFDASLDAGTLAGYRGFDVSGSRYWNRVKWMYRNPGYGIDMALGILFYPTKWTCLTYQRKDKFVLFVAVGPAFNIYLESRFGCLKLGWKAWNFYDEVKGTFSITPDRWPMKAPICFSISKPK